MLGTSKSPLKPEDVMAHIIRSYLGVDASLPEQLNGLSGLYRSVLSGKKALILLDNAASREQVESLLPPPFCALLVTSRSKFALSGLAEKDLDVLPLEDARKLLLEIAPRIGDHAEKLAMLCGCLPIALRNAAYALKEKPNLSLEGYLEGWATPRSGWNWWMPPSAQATIFSLRNYKGYGLCSPSFLPTSIWLERQRSGR